MKELGKFMKEKREAMGLSLRDASRLSGVSHTHIRDIEDGRSTPSFEMVMKFLKAYMVDINSLDETCSEPFYIQSESTLFIAHPHLLIQHGPPPGRLFVTGEKYENLTHLSYSYKGACTPSRDYKLLLEVFEVQPSDLPFPILPVKLPLRWE